jgi:protein-L-isoaspartate(D-aspartate) O-methyltransferase
VIRGHGGDHETELARARRALKFEDTVARLIALLVLTVLACRSRPEPPAPAASAPSGTNPRDAAARKNERQPELDALVAELARDSEIRDERVLAALRRVPRHRFVPAAVQDAAYENFPLPIGHGQTISQPAVVAVMTAAVAPNKSDRCLEIGTGSGYQAAVLAELCSVVYSIEYVDELARFAEANLRSTGYGSDRVVLRTGDGYRGWSEAAPFQVIVVTAAPERVPEPLLTQLAPGGRLVIPVGPTGQVQRLELHRRKAPGTGTDAFDVSVLMAVRFVPFVGEARERR